MKKKFGKKFAVAALALMAAAAVQGCGGKTEETASEETVSEETASGETEEAQEIVKPDSLGEIKLGEYKGIEVETEEPYIVTDEEVDIYIDSYILPTHQQSVDAEIEEGDTVNIDYVGSIDGVEFDGGSAEAFDLTIGSGRFIDGFEDGLVGYKKGDKVDVNVTFPDPYENNPDLAGKPALFEVTVNDVKRTPELTDEIVPELDPECKTAEEYKRKLKEMMQESADYSSRQSLAYVAIEKVVENSEITPTEEAVEWKVNDLIVNYFEPMMVQNYGISLDDMLSLQGSTREEYKKELEPVAEEAVKQLMVADEIARVQNLVVTDDDIREYAEESNVSFEEFVDILGRELAEETVLEQKAIDFVVDNAVVKYISASEAEAETQTEE